MNFFIKLFLFSQCILKVCSKNESTSNVDGYSESPETRVKKSILKNIRFKWTSPIHYRISYGANRRLIKAAIAAIEKETCIKFIESNNFRNGGLNYVSNGTDCYSFIGKVTRGRPQDVVLGTDCNKLTIAIHETMHALGVIHEFSRYDRNFYINVRFENIDPGLGFNFQTFPLSRATSHGLKYDFGSVMHYDRLAGSVNGQIAMEPRYWSYLKTIGQTTRFGFNDAKQLNIHYCSDKCRNSKLNCKMGGYPNPNDCRFCKCPAFFTGTQCTQLLPSHRQCGVTRLNARNIDQLLNVKGVKTCYFRIEAPKGRKVRLYIGEVNFRESFVCQPNKGLEIKFLADKAVSGAMLCGRVRGGDIISQDNLMVMKYVGLTRFSNIRMRYRYV